MRIRWRLALYGAFVAFVTMVVFTVVIMRLAERAAPQEQIDTLTGIAESVAAEIATTPTASLGGPAPVAPIDPAESNEVFFTVADQGGAVLLSTVAGTPPVVPSTLVAEARARGTASGVQMIGDVEIQYVVVPWANVAEGTGGVVAAGQSTAFLQQRMDELGAILVVASIITLLVSLIVGWFVSRRAMRPLRRLAETADAIRTTGDLSQRLPDVTAKDEVGALTASFNGMLARLDEAQRLLGRSLDAQQRFVADASHELRSPLTTIRSNAGFLIDRPDAAPDDRREAIADIAEEAGRMADLVDDLLTLARSDAGTGAEHGTVDLVETVSSVVRHIGGDRVTVDAPDRAVARGDQAALHRLVRTLVDNALTHGAGEVQVTVRDDPDRIRLRVADRGPGFPAEDLVRVFDRFYRADPARSAAGTGLGMAIAKEIVVAHGGSILAANRAGGGAVIEVDLPGA